MESQPPGPSVDLCSLFVYSCYLWWLLFNKTDPSSNERGKRDILQSSVRYSTYAKSGLFGLIAASQVHETLKREVPNAVDNIYRDSQPFTRSVLAHGRRPRHVRPRRAAGSGSAVNHSGARQRRRGGGRARHRLCGSPPSVWRPKSRARALCPSPFVCWF